MRPFLSFLTLAVIALGVASCEEASPSDESTENEEDPSSAEDDDDTEDDDEDAKKDSGRPSADAGAKRDAGGRLLDAATGDSGRANPGGDAKTGDGSQPTNDAGSGEGEGGNGSTDYSPCPTDGDPCKVLPLGDSITEGLGDSTGGGYRVELFKLAAAAKKNFTFVGSKSRGPTTMVEGATFPKNHEGYSGWTIQQIAGLVPDPALRDDPHIILLMAGTNDVVWAGPEGAPMRLDTLIKTITDDAPDALLVVAQLTPLGDSGSDGRAKTFNQAVPAIVEKHASAEKHVILVDMHAGVPASALADGVHPNPTGYAAMAKVWYEAIGPLLP